MITYTGVIFGSGWTRLYWAGEAENILRFVRDLNGVVSEEDLGDDGFVCRRGVPDSVAEEYGVRTLEVGWPPASDEYRPPEGFRTLGEVRAECKWARGTPPELFTELGSLDPLWTNREFVRSAYRAGVNPLPVLRRVFPAWVWIFHKDTYPGPYRTHFIERVPGGYVEIKER